ncbi:DUF1338 domain-containing protein [Vibrio viridaestus]|uniref:2-oxoadipate dioxygenase/decarboxylase n=1 Tax=Vibrio viridaestus TaxID=2487322 RepID=A0A3N9TBQ8_9VIBR|nr:DUF1338 domain-containing protein [Vibrio viridaestus]RQW61638.1 DUF1338 domain-containing protein [Vibrio viridaestus]
MEAKQLFDLLWQDYVMRLCPSALNVHDLLQEDTPLINDHIALRTFNLAPVSLDTLAKPFLDLGYQVGGNYVFEGKKLRAQHFEHRDNLLPKVFISELLVEQCSFATQRIIHSFIAQIDREKLNNPGFLAQGRMWNVSIDQYLELAKETEYGAWVAAHGYGANHFTVSVNQLKRFAEVGDVNAFLKSKGFAINTSGGEVKGTPQEQLEQSSTMADRVAVSFLEGELYVPGGFYEFAKRYPMKDGHLYPGFIAASADKIFESTHR